MLSPAALRAPVSPLRPGESCTAYAVRRQREVRPDLPAEHTAAWTAGACTEALGDDDLPPTSLTEPGARAAWTEGFAVARRDRNHVATRAEIRIWSDVGHTPVTGRGSGFRDLLVDTTIDVTGPEDARAKARQLIRETPHGVTGHASLPTWWNQNEREHWVS